MSIAYITHDHCRLHEMGSMHPECPERLSAINDRVIASGLNMVLHHHDARPASREQLSRVHGDAYLDYIFESSPEEGHHWIDGDTAMNPHSLKAALYAAGAATQAVDLVMTGYPRQAFCAVRPPGHHAERDRAMGFCIFNNIAVGAAHAIEEHGLERVAIIDFDVHHGNGTEHIFTGNDKVLFCSTFQHPFYPGSGHDTDEPNIVNVPMPASTTGPEFREAVYQHILPRVREFRPQLLMFSAGFDAHAADDMSHVSLIDDDYAWITRAAFDIVSDTGEARVVSMLEGGYELQSLSRSVEAHLKALMGGQGSGIGGGMI